jgi:hypothetical protein
MYEISEVPGRVYIPSARVSEHLHTIDKTGGLAIVKLPQPIEEGGRIVDFALHLHGDNSPLVYYSMIAHRQDEFRAEFGEKMADLAVERKEAIAV